MKDAPKVLIIGDSISIGYTPHAAALLAGEASVLHNPDNAGDTRNCLERLDSYLAAGPFRAVHFNCGLHDIKVSRQTHRHQVGLEDYRRNLAAIVERLQAAGAALAWAATTPVIEPRHQAARDFDRYNRDVDAYNAAAGELMAQAGVPVNDLHAVAVAGGLEALLDPDGVHFTDAGYGRLALAVADCLRKILRPSGGSPP